MRIGKCLLSGILTAAMLCGSLFYTGMPGAEEGLLQVYAADNVVLGKPVTVSEQDADSPNCLGSMVADGVIGDTDNTTGRWSGGILKAGAANNADQWVTIDLKAASTAVESIKVYFYKLVWSRDYIIQTSDSGAADSWENLYNVTVTEEQRAGSEQNPIDTISGSQVAGLKRYVRFFFQAGSLNGSAGGNKISIREIEIMGTQTGVSEDIASASEALAKVPDSITVEKNDSTLSIPAVSDDYDIKVYGSEVDRLVDESEDANGAVSPYRIGDRSFNVILKAENKNDASDTAKKNITVTVKDNTESYPELFPSVSNPNPMPDVLPAIQEWYGYEGAFRLTENTKIIVNDRANKGLYEVAEEMQEDLKEICGRTLKIETGSAAGEGNIYLESLIEDTYGTGEEGYFLVNGDNGIEIYSAAKTGVLYGTVTVEQILYQDAMHVIVPKGVIRDYPLYSARGMMFDVARIPTRMQFLQDYTKILKWYKMNEMQLHLNDTQWSEPNRNSSNWDDYDTAEAAHRLESELFPSLALQNAKVEREQISNKYQGDNEGRYDYYYDTYTGKTDENGNGTELYYTKDEYRQLQSAAGERGIKLIAELDTPGHATPYNKYVYNNQEEVITSLVKYGYLNSEDYLDNEGNVKDGVTFYTQNPSNYEVFSIDNESANEQIKQNAINARIFIKALFDEYMGEIDGIEPLFTTDTIHAGVDEYWDRSGNNPNAFRDYMNEMYDHLSQTGEDKEEREVRMWAGLVYMGGSQNVNRDIVLYMWSGGEDNSTARMNDGFRLVNIPQPYFYTTPGRYHKDMIREDYIYYNWTPEKFADGQSADKGEPLLLGAMAALWGDASRSGTTEADLHERYLRSIAMMSEKTWGSIREDDTFLTYEQTFDRLKEGPGTKIANNIDSKTNIVLDYNFENISEDGETIYDASGNGYDGAVTGGEIEIKDGETMLKFDGNTTIETPLTSLGYPYTMSFDLYLDGTESNDKDSALFSGYDGRLQVKGLNDKLGLNRSHYTQAFNYAAETNTKHRISIVGTYQATKLYVDGEFKEILYAVGRDPDHGGSLGNEAWTDNDNNFTATFVFPLNVIGENFSGYLGNIRAYNKALSTEEFEAEELQPVTETDVARNRFAYADNTNRTYFQSGRGINNDTMKLFPAWKATDGDGHVTGAEGTSVSYESGWYSSNNDNDFLMIDLGQERKISKVVIDWAANGYAASYDIMVSTDGKSWTTKKSVTGNTNPLTRDTFDETTARYVKMQGVARKSGANEYAIYEMKVYGNTDKTVLAQKCRETEEIMEEKGIGWESTGLEREFYDGLVQAKAVYADVMAGQEEVEAAVTGLEELFSDWTERVVQNLKDQISQKLAQSEDLLSKKADYETTSWNKFEAAYHAANHAGEDLSAEEYEDLLSDLTEAIDGLVKLQKNSEQIQQLAAPVVTVVKSQATGVKITWSAVANASAYQLYRTVGSSVTKVGSVVSGTQALDQNPVGGKNMTYHVVALSGNQNAYKDSAAGVAKSIQLPGATKKVTVSQVKGKRAVTLKWKKVKGASSYLIYRAEGKNGSYKKVGKVKKKVTFEDSKKLKKGKSYSYKIVAVVKKQYSPMKAAKKAVKIK